MNAFKNRYAYVLKSIKKDLSLKPVKNNLKDKNYVIGGGTRGIGFSIAEKLVMQGANVTILGKTTKEHPKLKGTIFSAAEEICKNTDSDRCTPIVCDIRDHDQINEAVENTVNKNGDINGVVLNASALCLNNTLKQTKKEIDLMNSVNINGTFLLGQACLKKMVGKSGHMLVVAPPIEMIETDDWWVNHLYYSMSKFNMSLMAKFWNEEFSNIGVNTLWPRTTINTAPVQNLLGGDAMVNISRTPDIMGEAAKCILMSDPNECNGKNFIDDEVLTSLDIDVEQYRVNKDVKEKDLMPDFFC